MKPQTLLTCLSRLSRVCLAAAVASSAAHAYGGKTIGFQLATAGPAQRLIWIETTASGARLLGGAFQARAKLDGHNDGYFKYAFTCQSDPSSDSGAGCTVEDYTDGTLGYKVPHQLDSAAAGTFLLLMNGLLEGPNGYSGQIECVEESDDFLCTISRVKIL